MWFKTIITATTEKTKRPVQKDNVSDIPVLMFCYSNKRGPLRKHKGKP